mgnify:CR=1 FL=1
MFIETVNNCKACYILKTMGASIYVTSQGDVLRKLALILHNLGQYFIGQLLLVPFGFFISCWLMYELFEGQSGDYWLLDCQQLTDA